MRLRLIGVRECIVQQCGRYSTAAGGANRSIRGPSRMRSIAVRIDLSRSRVDPTWVAVVCRARVGSAPASERRARVVGSRWIRPTRLRWNKRRRTMAEARSGRYSHTEPRRKHLLSILPPGGKAALLQIFAVAADPARRCRGIRMTASDPEALNALHCSAKSRGIEHRTRSFAGIAFTDTP